MSDRKEVAPWPDYAGNPIHEGDVIVHPNGESGRVVCWRFEDAAEDAWQVWYANSVNRLCLQIGERGRAVVRQPATTRGDED